MIEQIRLSRSVGLFQPVSAKQPNCLKWSHASLAARQFVDVVEGPKEMTFGLTTVLAVRISNRAGQATYVLCEELHHNSQKRFKKNGTL